MQRSEMIEFFEWLYRNIDNLGNDHDSPVEDVLRDKVKTPYNVLRRHADRHIRSDMGAGEERFYYLRAVYGDEPTNLSKVCAIHDYRNTDRLIPDEELIALAEMLLSHDYVALQYNRSKYQILAGYAGDLAVHAPLLEMADRNEDDEYVVTSSQHGKWTVLQYGLHSQEIYTIAFKDNDGKTRHLNVQPDVAYLKAAHETFQTVYRLMAEDFNFRSYL